MLSPFRAPLGLALLAVVSVIVVGCATSPPAPVVVVAAAPPPPPPPAPEPPKKAPPVLPILQTERGVLLQLPSAVLFASGKSELSTAEADEYIDRVAEIIVKKKVKSASVEGHTDAQGARSLNEKLSLARADVVRNALIARGVPPDHVVARGFAFDQPVATNDNEDGRKKNRRTEVMLLGETVANITAGEPASAFSAAFAQLRTTLEKGALKP